MDETPLLLKLATDALGPTTTSRADRLRVHRSTIHRWVTGKCRPREDDWEQIARALDIPVAVVRYGPVPVLRSMLPPRWTADVAAASSLPAVEAAHRAGVSVATIRRYRKRRKES